MPDTVAEHALSHDLPVRVVEHPVAIRAVAAPPAPGPGHQERAAGHGLHGDMASARSVIGVTAARSGVCTVIRAATGRAAAGSGKHAPAAETVVEVTAPRPSGAVHTAATSLAGPTDAQTRTSPSWPPMTP
jgi:hypothetical protein